MDPIHWLGEVTPIERVAAMPDPTGPDEGDDFTEQQPGEEF